MSFKLALIALVYPQQADNSLSPNVDLLQKANAWLQRVNSGGNDALLLIGVGFEDESNFKAMLKHYGLSEAQLEVIRPDQIDPSDPDDLGEIVATIAGRWIANGHKGAIPSANWSAFVDEAAYTSDGWWWAGVEGVGNKQLALGAVLRDLTPDAFQGQAATWATVLTDVLGQEPEVSEFDSYEAAISALTLSYWLTGFDAVTENNFFDFSVGEAFEVSGLDRLRVGFEAGRSHQAKASGLAEYLDVCDDSFSEACLIACLDMRVSEIREPLAKAFGGDSLLFWSLYSSIWPNLKKPMHEALDDLVNLRQSDKGDLDRPWQFVTDGWVDFAEE